jgi:hypothetical protein
METTTTKPRRRASYRTQDGTLWRTATPAEVHAQIEHDATRPLTRWERSRPKRKSERTHIDLVPLVGTRPVPIAAWDGLIDTPTLADVTPVVQIRRTELEPVNTDKPIDQN